MITVSTPLGLRTLAKAIFGGLGLSRDVGDEIIDQLEAYAKKGVCKVNEANRLAEAAFRECQNHPHAIPLIVPSGIPSDSQSLIGKFWIGEMSLFARSPDMLKGDPDPIRAPYLICAVKVDWDDLRGVSAEGRAQRLKPEQALLNKLETLILSAHHPELFPDVQVAAGGSLFADDEGTLYVPVIHQGENGIFWLDKLRADSRSTVTIFPYYEENQKIVLLQNP